jgi:hypothetical protein
LHAVSVQAVAGGPISTAGQDAPVELPLGVALEELLGPAGVRDHADEPVAALVAAGEDAANIRLSEDADDAVFAGGGAVIRERANYDRTGVPHSW